MQSASQSPHLLIIGYVWPEPGSSAAGHRMMQLVRLFREEGWEVTFASAAGQTEHTAALESMDISTHGIEVNSRSFDNFIRRLQPSVVMFDRYLTEEQFGWRVAEHQPKALRLLDTEDLHCLRKARGKAVEEGREFHKRDLLDSEIAKREVASILRSDLSLVISEAEMALLEELFGVPDTQLYYLPFMVEPIDDKIIGCWPSFGDRSGFVTIGNFRHKPNVDAVKYLGMNIWPLIRDELPEAELHVYGAYPNREILNLDRPEKGFRMHGRVEDAVAAVRGARVCLAPLRFGAGLKGKLVEAMQCGTPCVTTPVGAEGLAGGMDWCGRIADSPRELASAAVELYTSRTAWEEAQDNGRQIINRRFARDRVSGRFKNHIAELAGRLEEHRRNHFIGRLLMHHTMTSTRYMAKWIEEKNRT